jgi:hypothetical protein
MLLSIFSLLNKDGSMDTNPIFSAAAEISLNKSFEKSRKRHHFYCLHENPSLPDKCGIFDWREVYEKGNDGTAATF